MDFLSKWWKKGNSYSKCHVLKPLKNDPVYRKIFEFSKHEDLFCTYPPYSGMKKFIPEFCRYHEKNKTKMHMVDNLLKIFFHKNYQFEDVSRAAFEVLVSIDSDCFITRHVPKVLYIIIVMNKKEKETFQAHDVVEYGRLLCRLELNDFPIMKGLNSFIIAKKQSVKNKKNCLMSISAFDVNKYKYNERKRKELIHYMNNFLRFKTNSKLYYGYVANIIKSLKLYECLKELKKIVELNMLNKDICGKYGDIILSLGVPIDLTDDAITKCKHCDEKDAFVVCKSKRKKKSFKMVTKYHKKVISKGDEYTPLEKIKFIDIIDSYVDMPNEFDTFKQLVAEIEEYRMKLLIELKLYNVYYFYQIVKSNIPSHCKIFIKYHNLRKFDRKKISFNFENESERRVVKFQSVSINDDNEDEDEDEDEELMRKFNVSFKMALGKEEGGNCSINRKWFCYKSNNNSIRIKNLLNLNERDRVIEYDECITYFTLKEDFLILSLANEHFLRFYNLNDSVEVDIYKRHNWKVTYIDIMNGLIISADNHMVQLWNKKSQKGCKNNNNKNSKNEKELMEDKDGIVLIDDKHVKYYGLDKVRKIMISKTGDSFFFMGNLMKGIIECGFDSHSLHENSPRKYYIEVVRETKYLGNIESFTINELFVIIIVEKDDALFVQFFSRATTKMIYFVELKLKRSRSSVTSISRSKKIQMGKSKKIEFVDDFIILGIGKSIYLYTMYDGRCVRSWKGVSNDNIFDISATKLNTNKDLRIYFTTKSELKRIDFSYEIVCKVCSKKCDDLKRCSRCMLVSYCSIACQKKDWKRHKKLCQSFK